MPLLAWLNLIMGGMVLLAISPLTAAQIMLSIDRYLGGHFFDTQAGGSAVLWMHFFWIFGHPGSLHPGGSGICVRFRNHSGVFAQADLRISRDGRGDDLHRVHQLQRLGSPHVHSRDEFLWQHVLHGHHDGHRGSHRDQDLQLARDHVGREDSVQGSHAVLHRLSCSSS